MLQKFSEQTHRRLGIAALLDEYIKDFTFVIDRPPEPHALAADPHRHLIQVPSSCGLGSGSPKILGEETAKLQGPTANRLITGVDAALGQHLLDIAKAQGEPKIQPNGLTYDIWWEPMPFEADWLHRHPRFRRP